MAVDIRQGGREFLSLLVNDRLGELEVGPEPVERNQTKRKHLSVGG